jgi:hypothetical protein
MFSLSAACNGSCDAAIDGCAVEDECARAARSSGFARMSARSCFLGSVSAEILVVHAATVQTIYPPRFLGAIGHPDLGCAVHTPPHSFGPAAHAEDHQRLLREYRTGLAVAALVEGEPRTGCQQACSAGSPPDC